MDAETFIIKSLFVQNAMILISLGVVFFLLYLITIGGRQSMKVKGEENLRLLQDIGGSIDRMKTRTNRAKNP